ncbi:hypothetical protein ScPMuIL_003514 [Solemya velum]
MVPARGVKNGFSKVKKDHKSESKLAQRHVIRDFSINEEILKDIGPESPLNVRLHTLKALKSDVHGKQLVENAIEAVWKTIKDLFKPHVSTESRHVALDFLISLVEGQLSHLGDLREHFFNVICELKEVEDFDYRLKLLNILTEQGRNLEYFEDTTGEVVHSMNFDQIRASYCHWIIIKFVDCLKMDIIMKSECEFVSPLPFVPEVTGPVAIPNMAVPGQYFIVYQPSSVTTSTQALAEIEVVPHINLQSSTPDSEENTHLPTSIPDYVNCPVLSVFDQDVAPDSKRIKLETTTINCDFTTINRDSMTNFDLSTTKDDNIPDCLFSSTETVKNVAPDSKRIKLETTAIDYDVMTNLSTTTDDNIPDCLSSSTDIQQELHFDYSPHDTGLQAADYVTPTTTRTHSLSSTDSDTNGDYRCGEPFFNLLSTPPDSPLSTNPFFDNLKTSLAEEFKEYGLPSSLLSLVPKRIDIPTREQKLHTRFNKLSDTYPDAVHQLSGFYKYQTALVETERFQTLQDIHETAS